MMRIVLLCCCAITLVTASPAQATKVLVVAWDGSAYGVVRSLYQTNQLPNLKALGALGQNTSIAPCYGEKCMQVMSKPQYAAILTGRRADENRVWTNVVFALIPDGMTIYEKLRAKRGANVRLAHLAVSCAHCGLPIFGNIVEDVDVFTGCTGEGGNSPEELVIAKAAELIQSWRGTDWFIFLQILSTDHAGHAAGANSPLYRQAIVNADVALGRLVKAIGDADDAHVFVLGDHAMGTFNYQTGLANPRAHDISTPSTLFVYNRAKEQPEMVYPDQLVPRWLSLFGLPR